MELRYHVSPTVVNHHTTTLSQHFNNANVSNSSTSECNNSSVPTVSQLAISSTANSSSDTPVPPGLSSALGDGNWSKERVYMWDHVVNVAQTGHQLAQNADNGLAHLLYRTTTIHPAQSQVDNILLDESMRQKMRDVLVERRARRVAHKRALTREYEHKRRRWYHLNEEKERSLSHGVRTKRDQFDVNLLLETRSRSRGNSGAANRDAAQVFSEMAQAGGTAGGIDRWSKSITKVPDQNTQELPVDGGIFMEDPLREYYNTRAVGPWSQPERFMFLEKYVAHGKDFRRIASFLRHKSVAQCVQFYYDNKITLRLKTLGKGMPAKRRGISRNVLLELSKLTPERRNMADNFRHGKRRERDVDNGPAWGKCKRARSSK